MPSASNSEPSRLWKWATIGILFAFVTASRIMFRERSLWDWDELLFARAIHNFDLLSFSPHAPGYPVYVAFARAELSCC